MLSRGGGVPRKHEPGWRDLQLDCSPGVVNPPPTHTPTPLPPKACFEKICSFLCSLQDDKVGGGTVLVPILSIQYLPSFSMFVHAKL